MVDFETLEHHAEQGLENLDNLLIPMHSALSHWPTIELTDELAYYIQKGHAIQVPKAPTHGWVKLFARNNCFVGIGLILDDGRIAPKRLINPNPQVTP